MYVDICRGESVLRTAGHLNSSFAKWYCKPKALDILIAVSIVVPNVVLLSPRSSGFQLYISWCSPSVSWCFISMYWSTLDSVWFRRGQGGTLWRTEKTWLVIFRVPHSTPSPRSSIPLAPGPWCAPDSERQDVIRKKHLVTAGTLRSLRARLTFSGCNTCVAWWQKRKMFGVTVQVGNGTCHWM